MRLVVEMVLNGKIQENRNYNDGGTSNGYSTSSGHQHGNFGSIHSHNSPNRFYVSRAPVIAPPGFSGSTRAPPPCYTSVERMEQAFDINSGGKERLLIHRTSFPMQLKKGKLL
ncbi:uncharacterized protein LOC141695180 isoform X2 [Apium graveolens]|uniref:uncharacterized protein LOC141695180 isoform X2 n=1 Tax=Apium graveolens TaxID=4045 RepID=UPI003D79E43C